MCGIRLCRGDRDRRHLGGNDSAEGAVKTRDFVQSRQYRKIIRQKLHDFDASVSQILVSVVTGRRQTVRRVRCDRTQRSDAGDALFRHRGTEQTGSPGRTEPARAFASLSGNPTRRRSVCYPLKGQPENDAPRQCRSVEPPDPPRRIHPSGAFHIGPVKPGQSNRGNDAGRRPVLAPGRFRRRRDGKPGAGAGRRVVPAPPRPGAPYRQHGQAPGPGRVRPRSADWRSRRPWPRPRGCGSPRRTSAGRRPPPSRR